MLIEKNLAQIQATIEAACQRVQRNPSSVRLVAVTKQRTLEEIRTLLQMGIRDLGENRIEEASLKIPQLVTLRPVWHMIGHVQSRKAQMVVESFDLVHSLDSLKIAERYERFAGEMNKQLAVLVQVNVSGEDAKAGFEAHQWQSNTTQREALWETIKQLGRMRHLQVMGLMTMAPYYAEPEATRPVFRALRELRNALADDFPQLLWHELSMGMTNDYKVAIEEGATIIRIGRAIFEEGV